MKKALYIWTAVLLSVGALAPAAIAGNLVTFDGGIGVIPVSAGPAANVVRGVSPGGQPWVISKLKARVKDNGNITVQGEGLLLAGGNGIGTGGSGNSATAINLSVFATLICETAAPFTQLNTTLTGVQLDDNGDFRIDDVLTPAPPADCAKPVLLIRNAGNLAWFAAGIPKN